MKICWFGIYRADYSRNDILMSGLRMNDTEVIECNEDWKDKSRYRKLIKKIRALGNEYDILYAAYPATIPVILAKIFQRKPVVMDAFYSMYDAVVNDRKEVSRWSFRALKLLLLDWASIMLADYVITDTAEHANYWSSWLFVNPKKIFPLHLGVNDKIYFPLPEKEISAVFRVHFHGTYIPLQGIEKIVEAARILKDDPTVAFTFIGSGQLSKKIEALIAKYELKNIERIGRISPEDLNRHINKGDVVLGIFGDTEKTLRVIPNKVYEGMAARKALITMDSPAVREVFSDKELLMIGNDGESIAKAIKHLQSDSTLRDRLAEAGYTKIMKDLTPKPLGAKLADLCGKFLQ